MWYGGIGFRGGAYCGSPGCRRAATSIPLCCICTARFLTKLENISPSVQCVSRGLRPINMSKGKRVCQQPVPFWTYWHGSLPTRKKPSQILSETVIISYYRGTTQFDVMSTLACTVIHSWLITGSVPGGSYFMIWYISGHPQKSIRQTAPCCNHTTCNSL